MRFSPRGSLVLVAAVSAAACVQFPDDPGDSGTAPDAWISPWQQDSGGPANLLKPIADSYLGPDAGAPTPDAWVPADTRSTTYDTWGPYPTSNSGAICSTTSGCASTAEDCLVLSTSPSTGMCLGKCSAPGNPCPVADPTQVAACALQVSPTEFYCVYFCEVQGQTFSCPDAVSYSCAAVDPTQPTTKVCVPK